MCNGLRSTREYYFVVRVTGCFGRRVRWQLASGIIKWGDLDRRFQGFLFKGREGKVEPRTPQRNLFPFLSLT